MTSLVRAARLTRTVPGGTGRIPGGRHRDQQHQVEERHHLDADDVDVLVFQIFELPAPLADTSPWLDWLVRVHLPRDRTHACKGPAGLASLSRKTWFVAPARIPRESAKHDVVRACDWLTL